MPSDMPDLRDTPFERPSLDRLDSWKEIAAYLRCSERTVRRWELEGLPVHRHPHKKKAGIYAYRAEIDAWWRNGHERLKQIEEERAAGGEERPIVTRLSWWRKPWPMAGLALATAVIVVAWLTLGRLRESIRGETRVVAIHSIAVLPLENLSHDPEQEYFADGMTDELITDLAKIHALRVISRNSVMQYKGKHKPVAQIARELNVDAVVEGTVVRSGDRVRITAQLIAAPQDRHLWAEMYEGELRNVLALQDEVTTAIAEQISIKLTPEEQTEFARARPVDPEGHLAYLRGLYEVRNHTVESNAKAIEHFQRAIAIDPNDALAYEGLALAYMASPDQAPKTVMPVARTAALKAIELDDSLAEAHSSLGFIKLVFDWDWPGAEQELRRALELNPNSPLAHLDYARYLLLVPHRVDEAIQNCRRAYDLDPVVPAEFDDLVGFLFFARAYQATIDEAGKELEDDSPFLALAYAELGRQKEALAVAERAAASAKMPSDVAQTATAFALAGDKQRARVLLRQLIAQAKQRYLCGMNVGAVYSVLGDKDNAMAWLEKGYRDRSV
ncbi:MAG TPA: tetratricopeptide repeat protein [Candidatus Acidoferrum sp.]